MKITDLKKKLKKHYLKHEHKKIANLEYGEDLNSISIDSLIKLLVKKKLITKKEMEQAYFERLKKWCKRI